MKIKLEIWYFKLKFQHLSLKYGNSKLKLWYLELTCNNFSVFMNKFNVSFKTLIRAIPCITKLATTQVYFFFMNPFNMCHQYLLLMKDFPRRPPIL